MNVDLSLDALAAFEAVARRGSFTAAARELHVTQSAVSHRVRGLEAQLGYSLFVRSTRFIKLTQDGEVLARGVAQGLTSIRDALRAVQRQRASASLFVSCSPSFAIRWLVRNLDRFREAEPEIAVGIAASDHLESPGVHGVDVCIRFGAGRYPGVSVTRLSTEEVFVVASPTLIERTPLHREADIANHVLLHHDVMRDHPAHISWSRFLRPKTRRRVDPERGPRFSHAHMALEAALSGQGIALGRTTLVAADLRAGRLVAPLRRRVPCELAYWFLTTHEAKNERAIILFREWLTRMLAG